MTCGYVLVTLLGMEEDQNTPLLPPEGPQKLVLVKGRGTGPGFEGTFIRDRGEGRGPRVAGPKPVDLSLPSPASSRVHEVGKVDGIIQHKQTRERKTKLAVMGIPADTLNKGSPEYAAMVRAASKYRKARAKELYEYFGHVSSGVSALLAAESLAIGSSRFLYENAAGLEPAQAQATLKVAAGLADSARQHGLCAWELCAKESKVRERAEASRVQSPWIVDESGTEKRKGGRPRKVDIAAEAVESES